MRLCKDGCTPSRAVSRKWTMLEAPLATCVHLPLLCQSPQYATVLALDKAGSDSLQPGYLAQVLEICWISSQNSRVQNGHELVSDILTCQQLPPAKRINFDVDVHDIECRNLQVVVWATSSEHLKAEPPIKSRSGANSAGYGPFPKAQNGKERISAPVTMFLPCAFWIFLSLKACKSGWHFACPASGFRTAGAAQQLSSQTRTMSRFQAFWTKMLDHVRPKQKNIYDCHWLSMESIEVHPEMTFGFAPSMPRARALAWPWSLGTAEWQVTNSHNFIVSWCFNDIFQDVIFICFNVFQYVSCHSAYRVCSNERVIGCIGCDSWLPRASSFHRGWLKFVSVKCGRHWQWRLFGSLAKMVKSEVDSWSNRRNLWQDANGDPDMGDDHEKQMPGPSRVWFDEHWTQNTSSTRRTRQRHVFAGMFEARRAEARWRAGAIHVVLPDPNNGNTDMNIPLKLKRHQQNNLWVKHVYLLQGCLLRLLRSSVEIDVGECKMMQNIHVGTYQILTGSAQRRCAEKGSREGRKGREVKTCLSYKNGSPSLLVSLFVALRCCSSLCVSHLQ